MLFIVATSPNRPQKLHVHVNNEQERGKRVKHESAPSYNLLMADDDVLNGICLFQKEKKKQPHEATNSSAALISFNPFQTKKKVDCKGYKYKK